MEKVGFAAAVGALFLGALGACGNDPKPKIAPPSPSHSLSDSPSVSTTPEAETPEAFLRRYIEAAHKAEVSGYFGEYKALSDSNCVSCNQFIEYLRRIHKHGGEVRFAGERVLSIERVRKNFYKVQTFSPPTHYKESKNGAWRKIDGGKATAQYSLAKRDGHFVVMDSASVGSGS